jgi:hypothetical protein
VDKKIKNMFAPKLEARAKACTALIENSLEVIQESLKDIGAIKNAGENIGYSVSAISGLDLDGLASVLKYNAVKPEDVVKKTEESASKEYYVPMKILKDLGLTYSSLSNHGITNKSFKGFKSIKIIGKSPRITDLDLFYREILPRFEYWDKKIPFSPKVKNRFVSHIESKLEGKSNKDYSAKKTADENEEKYIPVRGLVEESMGSISEPTYKKLVPLLKKINGVVVSGGKRKRLLIEESRKNNILGEIYEVVEKSDLQEKGVYLARIGKKTEKKSGSASSDCPPYLNPESASRFIAGMSGLNVPPKAVELLHEAVYRSAWAKVTSINIEKIVDDGHLKSFVPITKAGGEFYDFCKRKRIDVNDVLVKDKSGSPLGIPPVIVEYAKKR